MGFVPIACSSPVFMRASSSVCSCVRPSNEVEVADDGEDVEAVGADGRGGGVHGMCGYFAAQSARRRPASGHDRDARLGRRALEDAALPPPAAGPQLSDDRLTG